MIFLKALIIGFSIAMPVGPIGMMCIKNTLSHGFKFGLATGLGAALADACYGLIAGGGLAVLSKFLLDNTQIIKLVGAAILLYIGAMEIKSARAKITEIKTKKTNLYHTVLTTFAIVIANPITIMAFIGVFAAVGGSDLGLSSILLTIIGVFCGSLLWWVILATTVNSIRHKISVEWMMRIRLISGFTLIGFALFALVSSF